MSSPAPSHTGVFTVIHDVAILGAGYAGFAAARALHASGRRAVLIDRDGSLLWESGRAFAIDAGNSNSDSWREFTRVLSERKGSDGKVIDGAIAEVLATEWARTHRLPLLYYSIPMAVESNAGRVEAVVFGTKAGFQRLVARQWIDATETGELARLIDEKAKAPLIKSNLLHIFHRSIEWPAIAQPARFTAPELESTPLSWRSTLWPNERCLTVELPGSIDKHRLAWVPALKALRATRGAELNEAVLSHGSVVPLPVYAAGTKMAARLPSNVVSIWEAGAKNGFITLAERFDAGLAAAKSLEDRPQSAPAASRLSEPVTPPAPRKTIRTEIAVAGAGTGGAVAALAAARTGRKTLAFDPLPFAGGIGSGGGIHYYFFGVKGGLQEKLDERIREIMPLFGQSGQVQGFHPDAKKIAIEMLFAEAGVQFITGAMLIDVERRDGRVISGLVAGGDGPLRIEAAAWIDSTGDGDLAARAGAQFKFGRVGDGRLHAYTQSSGLMTADKGKAFMRVVNYDSGYVDPTDSEDLTRARVTGICHYVQEEYDPLARPTYIAPAIGLRQARHVDTDYELTLPDLLERRRFPDCIGLTGSFYDNHSNDLEFETDDAMFLVWGCRQKRERTACEIPYRMLLPKGLDNVWIACRAAGVSEEAHHSFRMQRDMQRIGEASALAAALTLEHHTSSRDIPIEKLKQQLSATGAVVWPEPQDTDSFGSRMEPTAFDESATPGAGQQVETWLRQLREQPPHMHLWNLYHYGKTAREELCRIAASNDSRAAWQAACVLSMWGDPAGEPRLLAAIRSREVEFAAVTEQERARAATQTNWLMAIALVKRCATEKSLPVLEELAADATLVFNARTSIALTCERILSRHSSEAARQQVLRILDRLVATPAPNAIGGCHRKISAEQPASTAPRNGRRLVTEDFTWQLHLIVARVRASMDVAPHAQAAEFLSDERSYVRQAFASAIRGVMASAR